jgi:cysteine desulfurase
MTCYLDYNATTIMPDRVVQVLVKWATRGNASSIYPSAKAAKKMMECFKKEIAQVTGLTLDGDDGYDIVFTSGGSESNTWIITSAVRSYMKLTNKRAHVITSNVEHDNIMMMMKNFEQEDVDVTYVPVQKSGPGLGSVDPEDVFKAIRPNTCLITIMAANNETGIRNNIKAIGYVAKNKKIPFFSDAVQVFGKEPIKPDENNITAFSGSFHKLHGPTGTGIAIVKKSFLKGYQLKPLIPGHQNRELRGGTECIHNIAAAREAYKITFEDRERKNANTASLKKYLMKSLARICDIYYLEDFIAKNPPTPAIVHITPKGGEQNVLSNTVFISLYFKEICNSLVRQGLADKCIFISVGSACKTNEMKSSHVLDALGVPRSLVPGVIRISLGDYTTKNNIDTFISELYNLINDGKCFKQQSPSPSSL